MVLRRALKKLLRPGSHRREGPPPVDQLEIPNKIVQVPVTTRQCLVHCHVLEHFLRAKADIEAWADWSMVPTDSAWKFYVNMSVGRMVKWFEASFGRDLAGKIPPLDVLLVWYSMLQDPAEWHYFADLTGIKFDQWNWDSLFRAVDNEIAGQFKPPDDSLSEIRAIYPGNDLRDLMDISASLLDSTRPDQTTRRPAGMFMRNHTEHAIMTPRGQVKFYFDFHDAVKRQLQFAEGCVRFSWHRMYAPLAGSDNSSNELQFGPAIERYRKTMTLVQFTPDIQRVEPFVYENVLPLKPSLDVDLVWRTHMLMPREYQRFCTAIGGRLVPHVPSIPDLNCVDEPTARLYKDVFGEEYALCLCWPCVAGRTSPAPGSSPRRWPFRSAAKTQTEEEVNRGRDMRRRIPLEFSSKQCRKCGSHARQSCKYNRNSVDNGNLVARPAPPPTPPLRCVRGRPPTPGTPLLPSDETPRWWVEPCPAATPSPPSHPEIVSPIPRRPPIQFQAQLTTASEAPKTLPLTSQVSVSDFEGDNSVGQALTPSLTNGSTQSGGSGQEDNGGDNYTYTIQGPSSWQQATTTSPEDAVPRFTGNGNGTREGFIDPAVWWIGW